MQNTVNSDAIRSSAWGHYEVRYGERKAIVARCIYRAMPSCHFCLNSVHRTIEHHDPYLPIARP